MCMWMCTYMYNIFMHVPVHVYLKILTRLSLKLLQLLDYAAGDNLRTSSGDNKTTPLHLAVSIMIMNINFYY